MGGKDKAKAEFEKIYVQTSRKIFRAAAAGSRSLSDAEDVFQETYTDLLIQLRRNAEIKDPENYLITVLRRKLWRNSHSPEKNFLAGQIIDFSDEEESLPDEIDIEESIITEELYDEIASRLKAKDETVRQIFYLYYQLEMTLPEIAEQLDMPLNTVKSKLYRTLKEFRKLYGGV